MMPFASTHTNHPSSFPELVSCSHYSFPVSNRQHFLAIKMETVTSMAAESPYKMLLMAALSLPKSHYLLGSSLAVTVFMYNFLEMHFLTDLFSGFKGQPVKLTFGPKNKLYRDVVSKCKVLHGRYLSTPWLCSPHLQTLFLHRFGNPPFVKYSRQLFTTPDGGTLALDWIINGEAKQPVTEVEFALKKHDKNPIVIIIPGLSSHSRSAYLKHCAVKMAKPGRNVVVINHRGLGGVSLTSDWFYHGGWTGDIRSVVKHLNVQYPEAPLFLIGTSIGANMLVFYLAEDGEDVPVVGAASVCSPWDPLLCDRHMSRYAKQHFYSKALAAGLKGYAKKHKDVFTRVSNWEGIDKAVYCRDFDDSAFRHLANYETVDTYYRRGCSASEITKVKVPLLCISALDDPVCTKEAIGWDECRLNDKVVLATTEHGGHLPFFEGLGAKNFWWVRAVDEFLDVLLASKLSSRETEAENPDSSVDAREEYVNGSDGRSTKKQNPNNGKKRHGNALLMMVYKIMRSTWPFMGLAFALFFGNQFKTPSS